LRGRETRPAPRHDSHETSNNGNCPTHGGYSADK
jgi:hypothetical protein